MITIRLLNFGNDRLCGGLDDLLVALRGYRGRSIAVHFRTDRGLTAVCYWDVGADGSAVQSYGDQAPVDVTAFARQIGLS